MERQNRTFLNSKQQPIQHSTRFDKHKTTTGTVGLKFIAQAAR